MMPALLARSPLRVSAALAVVAVAVVLVTLGRSGPPAELALGERYAAAWSRSDFKAMYKELSDEARARIPLRVFTAAHRAALQTATATRIRLAGPVELTDAGLRVPLSVRTTTFGTLREVATLPLDGDGKHAGIAWRASLAFPGMPKGTTVLTREMTLPPRATLLTKGGDRLAAGPDRTPDPKLADVAAETVGTLTAIDREEADRLGLPRGTKVGGSGLERALDARLRGTPGGRLIAGDRVLARTRPRKAPAVRTTIVASVQRAATEALAGRIGGVVALDPRTGQILAFAGIPFSGLQPPGSTFKIITAAGALEAGIAEPADTFPAEPAATLAGVELRNAHGEWCGGTLVEAFARSCNSVFAPLGAELGERRLVDIARRFGFDSEPDIAGAATPTIPDEIGDELAVGSSAIGQGRVQATALTMATVAATIALEGRRPRLTLAAGEPPATTKATTPKVAREVERMMLATVTDGTGTAAAIDGVRVAGKTGTAELVDAEPCETEPCEADDPENTDAWFASYAPAGRPRVAVAVLLVRNGAGGDTAAPVARAVMQAALSR